MMNTKKYLCWILAALMFFALLSGGCGGGGGGSSKSTTNNQTQEDTTDTTNPNESESNSEESYSANGTWEVVDAKRVQLDYIGQEDATVETFLSAKPSIFDLRVDQGENGLYKFIMAESVRITYRITSSYNLDSYFSVSYIDFEHPSKNVYTYNNEDGSRKISKTITISDDGQSMQWHTKEEIYNNQNKFEYTVDFYFVRVN